MCGVQEPAGLVVNNACSVHRLSVLIEASVLQRRSACILLEAPHDGVPSLRCPGGGALAVVPSHRAAPLKQASD